MKNPRQKPISCVVLNEFQVRSLAESLAEAPDCDFPLLFEIPFSALEDDEAFYFALIAPRLVEEDNDADS